MQRRYVLFDFDNVVLWGCGKNLEMYWRTLIQFLNIKMLCDSNEEKQGQLWEDYVIASPNEIDADDVVIIMPTNPEVIKEIRSGIENRTYILKDLLREIRLFQENSFVDSHLEELHFGKSNSIMKKYVGIHYPATTCNLSCEYCYVRQQHEFVAPPALEHTPRYIRWCLSQNRLGGECLLVLCGAGETLLGDRIIDVCLELLNEGHYLHIVTNGTLTDKIRELVEKAGDAAERIIFKLSFHYNELKRRGLLDTFSANVHYLLLSKASFTVELTADDKLISQVEEIKQYSLSKFGAYPHITIARDDTSDAIPLLTKLSMQEYYKVWSQFESHLFEIKWKFYNIPIHNCDAGKNSLYIDINTGDVMKCLHCSSIDNIYDRNSEILEYERVGDDCVLPYCYNNHAYLSLGVCEDIDTYSFAEVRDRVTIDGKHWVKKPIYDFINQKLFANNK